MAAETRHTRTSTSVADAQALDPRRWLALVITLAATFLAVLDFFIVNISIPAIQSNLHASFAQVQLVVAGYGLAYATLMITGGRLGDIYGRKRMFKTGMAGFTLASAVCGISPAPAVLIVARVVQGAMAAIMIPQVLSIIQVTFPPQERATAFSLYGTAIGAAAVAGQIIGGALIQLDLFGLDWRPVFLVNLPIGMLALILAGPLIRESYAPDASHLDLEGVALVSTGLFLLIYPLVEGREAGWPLWAWGMLLAAVPVLAGFLRYERWRTLHRGSPLLDLRLFRVRAFSIGLLVALTFFSGQASFFLTLTLFLQDGLRLSPLEAGLIFVPFAVGFISASLLAAPLAVRLGNRVLNIGALGMALGLLMFIALVHADGVALPAVALVPALLIYGSGQGLVTAPLFTAILRGVPLEFAGAASGVLTTTQQLAGSLGVALIGIVFFGLLGSDPAPSRYAIALPVAFVVNTVLALLTCALVALLPRAERNLQVERPLFVE